MSTPDPPLMTSVHPSRISLPAAGLPLVPTTDVFVFTPRARAAEPHPGRRAQLRSRRLRYYGAPRAPTARAVTNFSALASLPPTLSTFDILGCLLRDSDPAIAALVCAEVFGPFIHRVVEWLERAEGKERERRMCDDRFAKGVQHVRPLSSFSLLRSVVFYTSLIELRIVDPKSDADSAAMAQFSLRNARFAEANALYKVLVGGCGEV
ncbi:hypothetical protein FB451DRAFT_1411872 [Mycena latifolia]|nr:hypothetical protein FB451DRAFT_1411872 [Mycena latifolia]